MPCIQVQVQADSQENKARYMHTDRVDRSVDSSHHLASHQAPALSSHTTPQSSHDHRAASFDFRIVPRLYTTGLLFFPLPWTWTCTYLYAVRHGACIQRYSSHRHNTVISYVSSYLHHDESQTTGKPSGTLKNYHAPRPTWTISPENSSIFRACDKSPDVSHVVHLAWHLWTWCSPLAVVCSTNTHLSTC